MNALELNSPGFSLQNARVCLALCVESYLRTTVGSPLAQALIEERDGCILVAFPGTKSIRDFVTDAEVLMVNLPDGPARIAEGRNYNVHRGFWDGFASMASDLREEILKRTSGRIVNAQDLSPALKPIFVTGHSLGGAYAILAAKFLSGCGFCVHSVYTFGQPRVGDSKFCKSYNAALSRDAATTGAPAVATLQERTWRVVNAEDPVPRLPGLLAGYRHCGREVFVPEMGPMRIDASLWLKLGSDTLGIYRDWKLGPMALLGDHFIKSYCARLGVRPEAGVPSEVAA